MSQTLTRPLNDQKVGWFDQSSLWTNPSLSSITNCPGSWISPCRGHELQSHLQGRHKEEGETTRGSQQTTKDKETHVQKSVSCLCIRHLGTSYPFPLSYMGRDRAVTLMSWLSQMTYYLNLMVPVLACLGFLCGDSQLLLCFYQLIPLSSILLPPNSMVLLSLVIWDLSCCMIVQASHRPPDLCHILRWNPSERVCWTQDITTTLRKLLCHSSS